ncbi:TetR/AcrR family transcriptional regulator [Aestuariibius sp. 2305UL40-4]|uniref:TetR/AcrR family transcriptional regulator n=1 Tax=Aestuariibius violaceus TaxID=3234132 RepID=UPI00345E8543
MAEPVQKRARETRARLIAAADALVAERGFEALRVEEVVLRAGVAKGTFFSHFRDKDALMDQLVGARINGILDEIEAGEAPRDVDEMVAALVSLMRFMTCERYVFDLILRYSGAAAVEEIGPIARTFGRQMDIAVGWLHEGPFRRDVPADLLAEGVQAFLVQAMALHFCMLHSDQAMRDRLAVYLRAWLMPAV